MRLNRLPPFEEPVFSPAAAFPLALGRCILLRFVRLPAA